MKTEFDEQQAPWMNSIEAAKYLRLSPGALRNSTHRGVVPYYKLGRSLRFKKADLDRLLEETRKGGCKIDQYGYSAKMRSRRRI